MIYSRIVFTALVTALSSLSYGKSKPYVGIGLTYTQPTTTKVGVNGADTIVDDTGSTTADLLSSGGHRIGGSFTGGYHLNPASWGSCFMEGELIARSASNQLKSNASIEFPGPIHTSFSLTIQQQESFGVLLRAGKYITDTFGAYVSGGALKSKFKTSIAGIGHGTAFAGQLRTSAVTKQVWGGRVGGGILYDLGSSRDFSVRLDYGYEAYQKYSTGNLVYFSDPGFNYGTASCSPALSYHVVTLSLIYKI